jgi:serine phosphatase RsbU (regulator of sigma subunit)
MLVIASDGLLDLLGANTTVGDAFGFLAGHTSPAALCLAVSALAKVRPPTDDVTIVAVRREG